MKKWLVDNAVWLGSVGAIAAVLALLWTVLAPPPTVNNHSIKKAGDGSVVADKIEGSTLNIGSASKPKE